MRVLALAVDVDRLEYLDGKMVVAQQRVNSEQANQAEVAEHLVQRQAPVVSSDCVRVFAFRSGFQLLLDVRHVNQRVENVEQAQNVPNASVVRVGELLQLVLALIGQAGTILRVVLELIHELIDQLPQPNVGQLQVLRLLEEDVVEKLAIIVERGDALLELGSTLDAGMDVAVVQLLVECHEQLILFDQLSDGLLIGPFILLEIRLAQLRELDLVHVLYVVNVSILDRLEEIQQETLDSLGNSVRWVIVVLGVVIVVGVLRSKLIVLGLVVVTLIIHFYS